MQPVSHHLLSLLSCLSVLQGQWKQISRYYVPSRTPTQVASHAQKHFLRQSGAQKRRSRFSAVEEAAAAAVAAAAAAAPLHALQHAAAAAAGSTSAPAASGVVGGVAVPGAPALPSFFAHALAAGQHTAVQMLPPPVGAPGARPAGSMPPPGVIVGGIAMGVPIGVLPPLPCITTASGTELPILPVMPGRINALAAPVACPPASASSFSGESTASEPQPSWGGIGTGTGTGTTTQHSSRPPSPTLTPAMAMPQLPELPPLSLHSHSRASTMTGTTSTAGGLTLGPAGGATLLAQRAGARYTPGGRRQQLLRLLELNEQQQQQAAAGSIAGPAGGGDGASSGSAPITTQLSAQQQQGSSVRRVPSATAALDTLALLAEAEAQSFEAAGAGAEPGGSSVGILSAGLPQPTQGGQAPPLVSAF